MENKTLKKQTLEEEMVDPKTCIEKGSKHIDTKERIDYLIEKRVALKKQMSHLRSELDKFNKICNSVDRELRVLQNLKDLYNISEEDYIED